MEKSVVAKFFFTRSSKQIPSFGNEIMIRNLSILRFLFVIPLFFTFFAFCQLPASKIDSLLTLLPKYNEDTSKAILLNKLCWEYKNIGNYDTAFHYGNAALQLAKQLNFQTGSANAYNNIGIIYWNQGNYEKALTNYLKALKILEETGNKKGIAFSYSNIGSVYENQGNYEKALNNYLKSLKIRDEIGDKQGIETSYNGIGNIYFFQGNYEKALDYYVKSLKMSEEIGDKKGMAYSNNNIGIIYFSQRNYEKALNNYLKALTIEEKIGDKFGLANSYTNIGGIYEEQKDYKKALDNYVKFQKISEEIGDTLLIAQCKTNIGDLYMKQEKFEEALHYYSQSLILFKKKGKKEGIKEVCAALSELFDKKGDYKQAYNYHKLYSDIKDTLLNEQSSKQIVEMNTKYETQEKEHELQIQQLLLNQKGTQIYILIALSILIFIIALLLIWQMRIKTNSRTIELQQKLLRSQMNPHFIFNALQSIQNYIYENNPHNAAVYLSKFAVLMRLILENSREEYIPLQSEIKTLELYLELQQLRFENRFNYAIDVSEAIDIDFIAIPPMLAQPFIENAIEHGLAGKTENGKINIRFKQEDKNILFEVEDNGIGILFSSVKKEGTLNNHKSLATIITKERLDLLNKNRRNKIRYEIIDLGSSENGAATGTKVIFSIPFKHL